jgi:hypothetical protein
MPQPRAYVGPQPRPQLTTTAEVAATERSTNTGETSSLPLNIIIPAALVVIAIIIIGLLLAQGSG